MPENVSYEEYFDVDNVGRVVPDESPRYPITVVEEDDEFITIKNEWGHDRAQLQNAGLHARLHRPCHH